MGVILAEKLHPLAPRYFMYHDTEIDQYIELYPANDFKSDEYWQCVATTGLHDVSCRATNVDRME